MTFFVHAGSVDLSRVNGKSGQSGSIGVNRGLNFFNEIVEKVPTPIHVGWLDVSSLTEFG